VIPVAPKPEPPHFSQKVEVPGQKFLKRTPNPTGKQWMSHAYWREILNDLDTAYNSICAYSCHWIPRDTGFRTVEHFKHKDDYPQDAYKWANYRLVCGTLNGRKGIRTILDPFCVQEGWFVLNFSSLEVQPGEHISPVIAKQVKNTIDILGLNDEGTCLQARFSWLREYIQVPFPFSYLEKKAPFLASELKRQNLIEEIRWKMHF
jgi:hypothetical protein